MMKVPILSLLSTSFLLIFSSSNVPDTVSAANENEIFLLPVQDTYVRGGSYADTNYGTVTRRNGNVVGNPEMSIKSSTNTKFVRESFVQFDLTELSSSGHSSVTTAHLELIVRGNNRVDPLLAISLVTDNSWGELTLTYNTKPSIGQLVATEPVPPKGDKMTVDLTNAVNDVLTASTNVWSIALTGGTTGASISFATKDDTQGREPYLVILPSDQQEQPSSVPSSSPVMSPSKEPSSTPSLAPSEVPTSAPSDTPVTSPPAQPVTVDSEPLDDTFVRDSSVNSIYGAYSSLTVSYGTSHDKRYSYIKMDIHPAQGSPLISEAKLELYVKDLDIAGMNIDVYPVLSEGWAEGTMTWNTQAGYDTANPIHTDLLVPAETSWMTIDLTDHVREKAALFQDTFSIAILPVENGGPAGLKTKFSSTESGSIPKFSMTFIPLTGSLPPTTSPSSAPSNSPTPGPLSYPQQLVSLDANGGLVYEPYANQIKQSLSSVANSAINNIVPDFSNAGYKGGGAPIPFVPVQETVSTPSGDDRLTIQAAVNAVSALTPDASGFRGAVLIEAGDYQVSEPGISVTTGGVVIRGQGSGTGGTKTKITYTSTTKVSNLINFGKTSGGVAVSGSKISISDPFVPVGRKTFHVDDASSFMVGDDIIVELFPNQMWIDQMSDMGQFGWTPGSYQLKWRRVITGIDLATNELTVDGPIVQAIEQVYGGAKVWKYAFADEISNVGIENIRLESIFASETDENHGKSAVAFQRVRDGWMRQVTAKYFWYGAVSITASSSYITVEDSAMLEHKGPLSGGHRYSFSIDDSDFLLLQRCLAKDGRHDFASGSRTPGPNVFVDSNAIDSNNDSGPHHRLATGLLYDNIKVRETNLAGELRVRNRGASGSGHGWSGAQIMFWNTESTIICDAPNGGMNWAIGNVGARDTYDPYPEPDGIFQSENTPVTPRSLYYSQLKERMGPNALHSVVLPEQVSGSIWDALQTWYGEGLFGGAILPWLDEEAGPAQTTSPLNIGGFVRDLNLLGSPSPIGISWTKVAGPGTVTFGDATALETTALFDTAGTYTLELEVTGGALVETGLLDVVVL